MSVAREGSLATFAEYDRHDALGLARLVNAGEVSPAEVLEAAVERVEARNPAVNAVVSRLYDQARAAIAAGLPRGPLTGVPYLLKDLGAFCAGTVTSCGSALFRDAVADHDSEIVARMRRAGLVVFGKTNTSELGLSTSVEPRLFGPTRNPWDPERSAGGSSGGAAAAVAAGMVPAAHATDGGGSIRIPASACGLFGLKPTRARTPSGPDLGESWNGAAAVAAAARLCEELGHRVEEARPEWDEPGRAAAALVIVGAHTRAQLELRGAALGRAVGPDDVEPGAWAVAEIGRQHGAADYVRAIRVVHGMGRAVGRFFTQWDALLTPTMCSPPHRLGVLSLSSRDTNAYRDALIGSIAFTAPFNGSGNPAMSVPLHWTRDGLPVGVQFVGPFGGEAVLFRLAGQLERARPWAQKRPPPRGSTT